MTEMNPIIYLAVLHVAGQLYVGIVLTQVTIVLAIYVLRSEGTVPAEATPSVP